MMWQVEWLASAYLSAFSVAAFTVAGTDAVKIVMGAVVVLCIVFGYVQRLVDREERKRLQGRIDALGRNKRRVAK